jgi:hypothetical protein
MNRNMEMRPVLQHGHSALSSGGIIAHSLSLAQARRVVTADVQCERARLQHPYAPDLARLLRARRERPRRCTADQRDELAPPCMTRKEHSEG